MKLKLNPCPGCGKQFDTWKQWAAHVDNKECSYGKATTIQVKF